MAQIKDLKLTDAILTADETNNLISDLKAKTCSELAGKLSNSAGYANLGQLTVAGVAAQDITALTIRVQCNSSPSNNVAVQHDRLLVSTPETLESYTFGGGENGTDVVRFSDIEDLEAGGVDPMIPVQITALNKAMDVVKADVANLGTADQQINACITGVKTSVGSLDTRVTSLENGKLDARVGQGLTTSGGTLKLNQRTNYSGFEFESGAVYINTSSSTHPTSSTATNNVALDSAGKIIALPATLSTYGTVKMPTDGTLCAVNDVAASGKAVADYVKANTVPVAGGQGVSVSGGTVSLSLAPVRNGLAFLNGGVRVSTGCGCMDAPTMSMSCLANIAVADSTNALVALPACATKGILGVVALDNGTLTERPYVAVTATAVRSALTENYYTKNQVDNLIDSIEVEVDLDDYYTKTEADEKFISTDSDWPAHTHSIDEVTFDTSYLAIGPGASAGATGVAVGKNTVAGKGGVAIGMGAQVVSEYHIAIGPNASTEPNYPVVIGYGDDGSDNPPGYPNATIKVSKDGVMMVGSKTVAMVGDTPSGGGGGTVVVDADAKELAGSMTDFRLVDGTGAGLRVRSDVCGMKFTTLTTDGFVGYNKTLIDKDTFVALVNRVAALEAKHT